MGRPCTCTLYLYSVLGARLHPASPEPRKVFRDEGSTYRACLCRAQGGQNGTCAREPVLRIAALHNDNFSRSQVDTSTGPEVVLYTQRF